MKTPKILAARAEKLTAYYQQNYPKLAPLAAQCFLNTIETTVRQLDDGEYFVITGDIPAMWLRDSSSQVGLYVRFAKEDEDLQAILESVIKKQAELVLRDPYANAFTAYTTDPSAGFEDHTEMKPGIWERKYEVDSLTAPIFLSYKYWKATGKTDIFDDEYKKAMETIVKVYRKEQDHSSSPYTFTRTNCPETDTLPCDGKGNPVACTGMTWSGFRPSDDRCIYGYLVPSNMAAAVAMKRLSGIANDVYQDAKLAKEAERLAEEIEAGIEKYGITDTEEFGRVYAYETDGMGHFTMMDDANVPSLLSIPYLGYRQRGDIVTENTRRFVLSKQNPFYFEGKYAQGIGSPHTPVGYIWHIALAMQALTSTDHEEILSLLDMLAETTAGTDYMHESFDPDDPDQYTRSWFAWANTLFAELLEDLMEQDFFNK